MKVLTQLMPARESQLVVFFSLEEGRPLPDLPKSGIKKKLFNQNENSSEGPPGLGLQGFGASDLCRLSFNDLSQMILLK